VKWSPWAFTRRAAPTWRAADADRDHFFPGDVLSIFELAILGAILVGFFWLIMYAANHARSKDEDVR
jgi:hypothetical protein